MIAQQPNVFSCGVFACAYAVALALNKSPNIHYILDRKSSDTTNILRQHLATLIRNEKIKMFPKMKPKHRKFQHSCQKDSTIVCLIAMLFQYCKFY